MNDRPQSTWKRPWKRPAAVLLWFVLLISAAFILVFTIGLLSRLGTSREMARFAALTAIGLTLAGVLITLFFRWIRHWRNFRRFLFGLACFATLVALFYAEEDVRGKRAWNQFKREWEAKGFRFELTAIAPPPVPDGLNFAMAPVVTTSYSQLLDRDGKVIRPRNTNIVDRMQMPRDVRGPRLAEAPPTGDWTQAKETDLRAWQAYYRQVATVTNAFPVPAQPGTPAADVLLALSKYDPVIEELRQAAERPQSRYPLTYDAPDPASILLPHLAPLKGDAQTLELRAIAELQAGWSGKALEDVKLILRLADAVRTEPFMISHLVRIAMAHIALQPVWEGLADHKWSDAQLSTLERELGMLNFLAAYQVAMRGEMAGASGIIDYLRLHPEQMSDLMDSPTFVARLIPSGWFHQNQLHSVRFELQYLLPPVDAEGQLVSPEATRRASDALSSELRHRTPYNALQSLLISGLHNVVSRFAFAQTSVDMARVACALERYRLTHSEYPTALDALTPQFIADLPHDIINGQPLHYSRTSDGSFVLYSVGWNETDDGGHAAMRKKSGGIDLTEGDWVWRYPRRADSGAE